MNNAKSSKKTTKQSPVSLSRRQFITRSTLAAGAAMYFPYVGNVLGANDRINIACIGVGGKGDSDSYDAALLGGNIIALVDVDKNNLLHKFEQMQSGKEFASMKPELFKDYRQMFDKMEKDIDAVTISTPDHHHSRPPRRQTHFLPEAPRSNG